MSTKYMQYKMKPIETIFWLGTAGVLYMAANNIVKNVWFQTISHPEFTYFGKIFINQYGKKSVPPGLIKNHLTPRGLAY